MSVQLETQRLLLRPFSQEDAPDLYAFASDLRVGPAAGWPPHTSVEQSGFYIRTVFSRPGIFAAVEKGTGTVIGFVGYEGKHRPELPAPDDEIGYALHPDFWGRGLIPEAVEAVLRWGFETQGLETVWCSHYDGNDQSCRVIEKTGFSYRFSQDEPDESTGQIRLTHYYALEKSAWQRRQTGVEPV